MTAAYAKPCSIALAFSSPTITGLNFHLSSLCCEPVHNGGHLPRVIGPVVVISAHGFQAGMTAESAGIAIVAAECVKGRVSPGRGPLPLMLPPCSCLWAYVCLPAPACRSL